MNDQDAIKSAEGGSASGGKEARTPLDRILVRKLLNELLEKLRVQIDTIEEIDHPAHPIFLVKTADSAVLIGNRGESLQALNYLLRKMVEQATGEGMEQFLIDVNHYQTKKIEELRQKALMLAERARLFKHDVEMSPMSAYERMIIHATFAGHKEVGTESQGEGKFRRVIIKYKGGSSETSL